MVLFNIDQLNTLIDKYLYNRFEDYSQFISIYDLPIEYDDIDYCIIDDLLDIYTNIYTNIYEKYIFIFNISKSINYDLYYGLSR